jgi:hypothetical protein
MPRGAWLDTPGTLHHVIVRGIERRNIDACFELRESQSVYNAIFDPENHNIAPKKG